MISYEDFLGLEESGISYGLEGQKILVYGGNTVGKTPVSCKFPKSLLLMGESGGGAIPGKKLAMSEKKDFTKIVSFLTDEKRVESSKEKYQTIILDCATDIIDLFEAATTKEFGVRNISEITGRVNGWNIFRKEFKREINKLTSCGYTVIFIEHEEEIDREFVDENGVAYIKKFIQPKGTSSDKSSMRFIKDLCDFRFFIKSNGIDENGRTIKSSAYCKETKEFYAGSRFAICTKINLFSAENVTNAIIEAQKQTAEDEDSHLVEFVMDKTRLTKDDYISLISPYYKKLFKLYQEETLDMVASVIGDGVKITELNEEYITELEIIYDKLEAFANMKGIVVD